jgi:hypothetical protein
MPYINRSPGTFIVFANLVVYGVICVEIWMWTVATVAAITVTLVLIALCAGLICRSVLVLLEDGADEPAAAPVPALAPPAPAARPVRPAVASRPAPSRPLAGHTA